MKHYASPSFWECYEKLPKRVQDVADKNFELLKGNPHHPSLHLKKVERYYLCKDRSEIQGIGSRNRRRAFMVLDRRAY